MKRFFSLCLLLLIGLVGCTPSLVPTSTLYIKGRVQIKVGDTTILTASEADIIWESLNESIATVSDGGVVEGKSVGTTFIRASLTNSAAVFDQVTLEVIPSNIDIPDDDDPIFNPDEVNVKLGIDLIDNYLDLFEGKRVGLITNPTGINSEYVSTIDILNDKVKLVALYSPEHGIRGDLQAGAGLGTYTDEKTGLPVYSLYGSTLHPTEAMLSGIDIMCIDLQDAGARYYTFVYTMAYAMEECAKYDIEFVVFDRPNPIGGAQYEGNILDTAYSSFIGLYPIIQRHGLTIAELAMLFNEEFGLNVTLYTILMEGWDRRYYYDDTQLPWVIPSPNFPSIETAIVYPGTCVFEGTNLSEGRGTTIPFQVIGAPYIDADDYATALNDLDLPGVVFRPAYFTPTFSKYVNELCAGVQVHVTNRAIFQPVKTGWAMIDVVRNLYPSDFEILSASKNRNTMDLLTGGRFITLDTYTLAEQFTLLESDTELFNATRMEYLLYPYPSIE
ncbi:MAG: exo-beta-N-acetylmuramidase NamZ domain-containing protein [Bacilli bacterium]